MTDNDQQRFIRTKARQRREAQDEGKVLWTRHATSAVVDDDLAVEDVERALEQGEIIEEYAAAHRALPDCLVLGRLAGGGPVHVVVAIDRTSDRIVIVTVYVPSEDRWQNDWRSRKE